METFREFEKAQQNCLNGVMALSRLQKPLKLFIDAEIGILYQKLRDECGANLCEKNCDLNNWKPHPNKSPPLDCEVCSSWRDAILAKHTSPRGRVMWTNSEPNLWSQDKWEVAKVYMPDGHKNHHSIGDFDIAALLCLMNQCKHFDKFELGGLCDDVINVRNTIMHSASFQLKPEDLLDYVNRIRKLGEVLEKHVPDFKSLSEDIDEAVAKEAELLLTKMQLEELERELSQFQDALSPLGNYYALTHKPRGLCVVINNEDFQGTGLGSRRGTQEDEKALRTVFTRLGFTVLVHNNLTAGAMRRELQELGSRNFSDEDALVVCVLSHGEIGCVFGTDEQKVYIQELTRPFISSRAPTLTGKPKLFFIQACQGSGFHKGPLPCPPMPRQEEVVGESPLEDDAIGVSFEEDYWDADFLLGMATVPQCMAYRNTQTGSIYIQELCKQLTRSGARRKTEDIHSVLTHVNREVSKGEYIRYKQIPEPKYTLTKKLVLKDVCDDPDQVES